jgi:hypothetical protein
MSAFAIPPFVFLMVASVGNAIENKHPYWWAFAWSSFTMIWVLLVGGPYFDTVIQNRKKP